jgi:hypothetical protein
VSRRGWDRRATISRKCPAWGLGYLLLRGVEGTAAWVSRIALVPFVVFYSAWEVLQGIGVGILVNELKG